ncbi:MAG: DUF115 domain-containing protein [Balneola sp.]|nr:MAG: DUF115 domain-containing protein [Balneola sp.]
MIKKTIAKIIEYLIPEQIHLYLAKKEEVKRILTLRQNSKKDEWLSENKDKHKGERCFILATGPSLNKVDLSRIEKEYTIGVNSIYKIANEINLDYYIYVSNWYWKNHVDGIKNLKCDRKFLPVELQENLESEVPTSWINVLRPKYNSRFGYPLKVPSFFSKQPDEFFTAGGTVIFLALQLAHYLGFKEAVILGLDHTYKKDDYKKKQRGGYIYDTSKIKDAHFDKDYAPEGISVPIDLEAMENAYIMAHNIFKESGRKVLNASPGTMLEVFPKVGYNKLF